MQTHCRAYFFTTVRSFALTQLVFSSVMIVLSSTLAALLLGTRDRLMRPSKSSTIRTFVVVVTRSNARHRNPAVIKNSKL